MVFVILPGWPDDVQFVGIPLNVDGYGIEGGEGWFGLCLGEGRCFGTLPDDSQTFDDLRMDGMVAFIRLDEGDLIDHIETGNHLAEHGMNVVQPRCWGQRDEELAAIGVGRG